jgi:hypothetical protein
MIPIGLLEYYFQLFFKLLRQIVIFLFINGLFNPHSQLKWQNVYLILIIWLEIVKYFLADVAWKFGADRLAFSDELLSKNAIFIGKEVGLKLVDLKSFTKLCLHWFDGLPNEWNIDLLSSWIDDLLTFSLSFKSGNWLLDGWFVLIESLPTLRFVIFFRWCYFLV